MNAIFDPGEANITLRTELRRSGIRPLQRYFDPQLFSGPNDPAIGGDKTTADSSYRTYVMVLVGIFAFMTAFIIMGWFMSS